jgi:hypothetical protein
MSWPCSTSWAKETGNPIAIISVDLLCRPHKPKHYEDMLIAAQLPGHQASDEEEVRPSKIAATDSEMAMRYKICKPLLLSFPAEIPSKFVAYITS